MASSIDSKKSSKSGQIGYLKQTQQDRLRNRSSSIKPTESESEATINKAVVNHITDERRIEVEEQSVQRGNDSFYKIRDRGSRFYENGKNYVIEAYAPKEEKDNIRVTVQNDKAVISGHRQFGDEFRKGNKLTSTNNYQTFREEFNFKTPVAGVGLKKERNGDFIRFVIPKLADDESKTEAET